MALAEWALVGVCHASGLTYRPRSRAAARGDHHRHPGERVAALVYSLESFPVRLTSLPVRAVKRSIGTGTMVAVLFVPEISSSVCR